MTHHHVLVIIYTVPFLNSGMGLLGTLWLTAKSIGPMEGQGRSRTELETPFPQIKDQSPPVTLHLKTPAPTLPLFTLFTSGQSFL